MSALSDSGGHSLQCQFNRIELQINDLKIVTVTFERLKTLSGGAAGGIAPLPSLAGARLRRLAPSKIAPGNFVEPPTTLRGSGILNPSGGRAR